MRLARHALEERRRQPRLADAGLAGEQYDLTLARLRLCPASQQKIAFFLAPNEGRQFGSVQRLEAALLRASPYRRPNVRRSGNALEVLLAEVVLARTGLPAVFACPRR
jgi:hypothetical protein